MNKQSNRIWAAHDIGNHTNAVVCGSGNTVKDDMVIARYGVVDAEMF